MINPTTMSESLLFATVQITAIKKNSISTGTGFFYEQAAKIPGKKYVFLVTNRHVIEGASIGRIKLHLAEDLKPSGKMIDLQIDDFENQWVQHPDPNIDLSIMNLVGIIQPHLDAGTKFFVKTIPAGVIPSQEQLEELSAIQSVVMYGYPVGVVDQLNNLPITRRGIAANHPAIDFEGQPHGLVDIAVFPGSSGSPIFILDEGVYRNKYGATISENRAYLLGIQFSGIRQMTDGELQVRTSPTGEQVLPVTPIFAHLAFYVKARELKAFVEDFVALDPELPDQ